MGFGFMTVGAVLESKAKYAKETVKLTPDVVRAILAEAQEAGLKAGSGANPTPMVVKWSLGGAEGGMSIVADGMCGFAWINVKSKGRGIRFINLMKKMGLAGAVNEYGKMWKKDGYYTGFTHWVDEYNQSYERKLRHAEAYAAVLNSYGIPCRASGRLD